MQLWIHHKNGNTFRLGEMFFSGLILLMDRLQVLVQHREGLRGDFLQTDDLRFQRCYKGCTGIHPPGQAIGRFTFPMLNIETDQFHQPLQHGAKETDKALFDFRK